MIIRKIAFVGTTIICFASCLMIAVSGEAFAQPQGTRLSTGDSFRVGQVLGDGKNGRTYAQWSQNIKERGVETVVATVRRQSGGDGTFVNLRFGDGQTFENGKRIFLKDNRSQSVSWSVGGAKPNGAPLVLNAYDGEVVVDRVEVRYSGGVAAPLPSQSPNPFAPPPPKPIPRPHGVDTSDNDDHDSYQGNDANLDDSQAVSRCRRAYDLRNPEIEISELRPSGGLFSGKYKVRGSIRGNCIEEAGYYENGRLREKIEIPLSDRFQRKEFTVSARSGRGGEIRAFNTRGDEDARDIDREIQNSSSSQGNPFNF